MKKIHRSLIKGTNWALAGLLSLVGYSCSNNNEDELVAEYGTPHASYAIKGKVTNESHEAIPYLQVEVIKHEGEDNYFQDIDTLYTDKNGDFSWENTLVSFGSDISVDVITQDIDGNANGSYLSDTTTVSFKSEDMTGPTGHWYFGKAEKEIAIVLKEETKEPEAEE
ncbi:putative lipoprotein (rSAM/lipoprotein system) [Parabacteroides sp. PF5-5]|uniref:radical SAM-associated putative lipoprotein n=1 Tax=unclassified Parabacteroides TaxID=2649774 RepID=UPI002474F5E6|nr:MULTISPECIES: radical SAM-associated putative lipoprotein [unclassified Parabacteroides]MDH6306613.1 putative lipoprotein (rSAM/lipoprotein system) [Parabacteroides sp. PH5-39]MDH6317580.1 putative lipoprotein (rSAM/lipoprotein system) [Parabacteroides sp. PF5-13]MDH6321324.1 putative lipoprotein (rSAM/lipoprotein system) [Parabacteroides sp. PH5-13]MDH6325111.1 putative lipoprotein (rSAM/lipoprotein system) [Parabacteroides sp. PH5-8]MDH6328820.1 putative lipoprotein (rSAM/lipoprotein syst